LREAGAMSYYKREPPICCEACGDYEDLSYIRWENRTLCTSCFAEAVKDYAVEFPFLLAEEMNLDVLRVPEF